MSVPRLSWRAEIPMTAIMIAAASPTTTILRWVVRFAVYSDQFMSLTKSAPSPKDYCISRQRTYTKVQVAAVLPYSTVARLLSTSRASLFGLPAARYPTAGIAVRCARAAIGQTAAPVPSALMKSRRLIAPSTQDKTISVDARPLEGLTGGAPQSHLT
jgi:hypothetical protein